VFALRSRFQEPAACHSPRTLLVFPPTSACAPALQVRRQPAVAPPGAPDVLQPPLGGGTPHLPPHTALVPGGARCPALLAAACLHALKRPENNVLWQFWPPCALLLASSPPPGHLSKAAPLLLPTPTPPAEPPQRDRLAQRPAQVLCAARGRGPRRQAFHLPHRQRLLAAPALPLPAGRKAGGREDDRLGMPAVGLEAAGDAAWPASERCLCGTLRAHVVPPACLPAGRARRDAAVPQLPLPGPALRPPALQHVCHTGKPFARPPACPPMRLFLCGRAGHLGPAAHLDAAVRHICRLGPRSDPCPLPIATPACCCSTSCR
jgi:hypothetical protein